MPRSQKSLSVFSLVMINVIAVDSLRSLPITAKLGLPLLAYYLIAALCFFVPVALVAAELATTFHSTGGIYIWVRAAFGNRIGFISIWLQWIYNVVWYPTILAFMTGTVAYLISPELAESKIYLLSTTIILFWCFTLLNCFGMKISNFISIMGAIFGTLIPMVGISILGIIWMIQGQPLAVNLAEESWLPNLSSASNFSLFAAVLFGLIGVEMSAVHTEEVKNPQRDYPRALLYSTIIILTTLAFGALAIVMVVPNTQLSVVSGLIDAYDIFFKSFKMPWMTTLTAVLIILGGLSGVSTWIIGPSKGLMIAAQDGCIPQTFAQVNRHGAPVFLLIFQAIIVTILSSVFVLVDSINAAYWLLSDLCAQMALLVYVFMFAAAIKLRYSAPDIKRAYQIPGGKLGMNLVAGTGLMCCLLTFFLGFVPPSQIPIDNIIFFESFLIGGLSIFIIVPWFLSTKNHRSTQSTI